MKFEFPNARKKFGSSLSKSQILPLRNIQFSSCRNGLFGDDPIYTKKHILRTRQLFQLPSNIFASRHPSSTYEGQNRPVRKKQPKKDIYLKAPIST